MCRGQPAQYTLELYLCKATIYKEQHLIFEQILGCTIYIFVEHTLFALKSNPIHPSPPSHMTHHTCVCFCFVIQLLFLNELSCTKNKVLFLQNLKLCNIHMTLFMTQLRLYLYGVCFFMTLPNPCRIIPKNFYYALAQMEQPVNHPVLTFKSQLAMAPKAKRKGKGKANGKAKAKGKAKVKSRSGTRWPGSSIESFKTRAITAEARAATAEDKATYAEAKATAAEARATAADARAAAAEGRAAAAENRILSPSAIQLLNAVEHMGRDQADMVCQTLKRIHRLT